MTPEDRREIFLRLAPDVYGRYWKTNVALHLEVARRTVANWLEGTTFPEAAVILLLQMYKKHGYSYKRSDNRVKKKRKSYATPKHDTKRIASTAL
jgi:hypothetical protein